MARMIDADRLLRELTALSHGQVWPGWTYDGIRLLIERQPHLTQPNEPLTLEELREMDGQPVWVKQLKGLSVCDTDWAVVEFRLEPDVKHDKIRVWWPGSEDEDTPSEDDYGKSWPTAARRRERRKHDRRKGGLHDERAKNPGHE